jgi:hypothetical protein
MIDERKFYVTDLLLEIKNRTFDDTPVHFNILT